MSSFASDLIRSIFYRRETEEATISGAHEYGKLDPDRIDWIKQQTFAHYPVPEMYREKEWKQIQNIIDTSLRRRFLKRKRF